MKKNVCFLLNILLLCSCEIKHVEQDIHSSNEIFQRLRSSSNGLYYLDYSVDWDRSYYSSSGGRITLPKLPHGFILKYNRPNFSSWFIEGLPYLSHELNSELYEIIENVTNIYTSSTGIYVKTLELPELYFIHKDTPDIFRIVANNDMIYTKNLEFLYIENGIYQAEYLSSLIGIQDEVKNTTYNVEYATPLIGGITKIIMSNIDNEDILVGETIYSYFSFYPKSGKISFFLDESDYIGFIQNFDGLESQWKSEYLTNPQSETSYFENYTISEYSQQQDNHSF